MKSKTLLSKLLLGTTALTAALSASTALAQTATPAPQDTSATPAPQNNGKAAKKGDETVVVITGIRGSLQTSTQIKRKAATFVDSITASDVSALPDTTVSEALGRVPGVSVTRYQYGGASPDFPAAEGSSAAWASSVRNSTAGTNSAPMAAVRSTGRASPRNWSAASTCTRTPRPN